MDEYDRTEGDAPEAPEVDEATGLEGVEVDAEDLAMIALGTGVASLLVSMFGVHTWIHFFAMPLGAVAVFAGYKAQRLGGPREKQAIAGFVCGVVGLCFWLIASAISGLAGH